MALKDFVILFVFLGILAACAQGSPTAPLGMPQAPGTISPAEGSPTIYPFPPLGNPVTSPAYPPPSPPGQGTPAIPSSDYQPQADDFKLARDKVFFDLANSSLQVGESQPVQVSAILVGYLSDPCHQLRVVVTPADAQKRINLEVYSLYDPNAICITMIKDFTASIPLGSYSGGHFSVYVNGELLGEFDA